MNTSLIVHMFLLSCFWFSHLSAQSFPFDTTNVPRPEIGWGSLQNRIKYPGIAQHAHWEGFYHVMVQIDTSGSVLVVKDSLLPEIFRATVQKAIRSTKWIAGMTLRGSRVNQVNIPLIFSLTGGNPPLVIQADSLPRERTTTNK